MRSSVLRCVLLVALAGCDGVFGLTHIGEPADAADAISVDSQPTCTVETFTGGIPELLVNWDRFAHPGFALQVNADQLVPQILMPNTPGYAWVYSNKRFDMTNATATIEVLDIIEFANGDAYFSIDLDDSNLYSFMVLNGNLGMRTITSTTAFGPDILYDPVAHRFWRFEQRTETMRFLTSVNGADWTLRETAPAVVPIDSMRITIGVGAFSGGIASPAEARFDNFELCRP